MATFKQRLQRLTTTTKNSWAKIRTRLGGRPVWQLEEGHVIEPAFISNGRQYYRLKDYFNTFSLRGLMALQVYEEWNMRMTREQLQEFITKSEKILSNPKAINIGEIARLVMQMKERLELVMPTSEIVYKFASVAFFDSSESPYSYDPEYCKAKIQRWKEAADISDFFIVTRLKDMVPLPTLSEADLRICLSIVDQIADVHSKSAQA
jgi:hypothetical protein